MHVVILGEGSHARMLQSIFTQRGIKSELRPLDADLQDGEWAIIGLGATGLAARKNRFKREKLAVWTRRLGGHVRGVGVFMGSETILGIGVSVGNNVVIYSGCILEHDTVIADHAFLGPGVVCCGGVTVGEGALIGANATLLPNIGIGPWARVGAGAVVTKDIPAGVTVKGVPAR